jgi:membrane-associated phospholipid phosphatase
VRYLDVPVALFVKNHLYGNMRWARLTSNLPDLLLVVVLLTTFVAFSIYLVRTKRGIYDTATNFAKLLTWTAPASFLVKHFLKFVFGRMNTRHWMQDPGLYGFYWFQRRAGCDGFPSGHMLVVVALLAVLCRFYPKSRPFCVTIAGVLAVALIATNYHFVSDVIAGAYLGVLIEAVAFRILLHEPPQLTDPAI